MTTTSRVMIVLLIIVGGVVGGAVIEHGFSLYVTMLLLAAVVATFGVLPILIMERREGAP